MCPGIPKYTDEINDDALAKINFFPHYRNAFVI